ncbi:hypothetical protein SAMN05216570_2382 [Dyella sp. OK004]|uniref:lectin n=1 Tax=Dyella sp. OK004 TaxID=1855292 RepID=UPI0008DFFFF1|nr:lectin [Dyella sp. OK004]SFS08290.1 hypothetical protein SAMN05216570_2382 [Dyella sp. OK004]
MTPDRILVAALLASLLAACSGDQPGTQAPSPASTATASTAAPPAAPAVDALAMASFTGYGDMRFGMDEAAFRKAWGGELKGQPPVAGSTCTYLYPKWVKAPAEIGFMLEGGHFVRYDVTTAKEIAPGGGKIGMDKAQLLALYGSKAQEQPDKYVPDASTLRVEGDNHGIVLFELGADGKVNKWRVGVPPQVDYVEGCG